MSWWVTFVDATPVCIDHGSMDEAREIAEAHGTVKCVQSLPYPARPRFGERKSACPSFCIQPDECAGRTSCPRDYACDD